MSDRRLPLNLCVVVFLRGQSSDHLFYLNDLFVSLERKIYFSISVLTYLSSLVLQSLQRSSSFITSCPDWLDSCSSRRDTSRLQLIQHANLSRNPQTQHPFSFFTQMTHSFISLRIPPVRDSFSHSGLTSGPTTSFNWFQTNLSRHNPIPEQIGWFTDSLTSVAAGVLL